MNSGTNVGFSPHTRQEASPTHSYSLSVCACGADADGYDAYRCEPVCRDCARLRCDGGQVEEISRLPGHVQEAIDEGRILHESPQMAAYEYEEKFLSVEFEERECRVCEGETHHRIETDSYRGRTASVCSTCGETTVTVTDGGSNLYTCDTPRCGNWKEVVTPDGYVCRDCADELEKQYQNGEEAKLLTDGGTHLFDGIEVGDVCLDLSQGRPLQVIEHAADTVSEWCESNNYNLLENYGNRRLGATENDTVWTCVYVGSLRSEPTKSYDFPSARLARIEVESAHDERERIQRTIQLDVLADLFEVTYKGEIDVSHPLRSYAREAFGDKPVRDAEQIAEARWLEHDDTDLTEADES